MYVLSFIYLLPVIQMYEETLIHVATAYLNTNYISVEDICNCFGYGCMETEHHDEAVKRLTEVLEPLRDARFQDLQDHDDLDDGDLEIAARVVAVNVEHLFNKFYTERGE